MPLLIRKYAIIIILALGNFIWLLSLPATSFTGLWFQTEPVLIARYILCAILALSLIQYNYSHKPTKSPVVWNVISIYFLLMALFGVLSLGFVELPGLSFFGSPELGEGIAGNFAIAIMITAASIAYLNRKSRLIIGVSSIISILVVVILLLVNNTDYVPFYFNDFTGAFGAYLIVISITWFGIRNRYALFGVAFLGLLVTLASENRASVAALILAFIVYVCFSFRIQHNSKNRSRLWGAALSVTTPILTTAIILLISYFSFSYYNKYTVLNTIISRGLLSNIIIKFLTESPSGWLVGAGWGHFTELLIHNIASEPIALHAHATSSYIYWDSSWRADFHSHNQLIEILGSSGLPGAICWLVILALLPLTARWTNLPLAIAFSVFLGVHFSFWFEMPTNTPFLALAFAGVARKHLRLFPSRYSFAQPALLVLIMIIMIFAAATSLSVANSARKEVLINLGALPPPTDKMCSPFFYDYNRGGGHLSWLMRSHLGSILDKLKFKKPLELWELRRLDQFLCQLDVKRVAGNSLRILADLLIARADIAFAPPDEAFDTWRSAWLHRWGDNLNEFLVRVPNRTDLAAPYFNWLLIKGDENILLSDANTILINSPNDPVGLWFSGLVLLNTPNMSREGYERMRQAIIHGIERIFPVDPAIKLQLKQKSSS